MRAFFISLTVLAFVLFGLTGPTTASSKPSPAEAIRMLQEGNQRFVSGEAEHPHTSAARLRQAGTENQGDHAYATVITCSDSRVPVERIFDAGVMDIFVIRVAGNVADTDEIGSIEYGLAHVHTPVLVVLGHTQCGAVTAVTHAVHGTGHPLERNIPPLVDNIIPAVKRAMSLHPDLHGDDVIPEAIVENVWQGVEDLFLNSPSTRELVKSGKAKVVGAIYDVGTGQVEWLPEEKVGQILKKVEADPNRALNAMADSGHGDSPAHEQEAEAEHAVIEPVPVSLADAQTMDLLRTDWLKVAAEPDLSGEEAELSATFYTFIGVVVALALLGLVLFSSGAFRRSGLKFKLYAGFGGLVLLALVLGLAGYFYIRGVSQAAHLESAFLDLDMMAAESQAALNEFLLHGIEDKEYGDRQIEELKGLIKEYEEDAEAIAGLGILNQAQSRRLEEILAAATGFGQALEKATAGYQRLEEAKKAMAERRQAVNETLEEMSARHESELARLERSGANKEDLTYQTRLVEDLAKAEIHALKLARSHADFLLDKNPDRIEVMNRELGLVKAFLKSLIESVRKPEEKRELESLEVEVNAYASMLGGVIKDEALIMKVTSELTALVHLIENKSVVASHEMGRQAEGMVREANLAVIIMIVLTAAAGLLLSLFIARLITGPISRIIESLTSGAEQVSAASGQVSAASQSLAEGASENAASLEETSASLEEMSSMTKANADSAAQADALMKETRGTVGRAGQSMHQVTGSMDEISSAGQEIGKIIKTIDEIAFQTNLLALNAAVEAARAGEAGAGFAVVADEVRNLAMRAAEAAKNTAGLIESTIKKIEAGNNLVKSTDEAFQEVSVNADKVGELISEITAAGQEQAQGIDQLNTAMTQMDQVTQKSAADAEESAGASEELNAQAETMMETVDQLMALIGGAGAGRNISSASTRAGNRSSTRTGPKRKVVSADRLLPMKEDFNDF